MKLLFPAALDGLVDGLLAEILVALLTDLLFRRSSGADALADRVLLAHRGSLSLGSAGLVPLILTLLAEAVDHELGSDHRHTVGAGGFADGVAHLSGGHECALQHLALDQLSGGELGVCFGDDRFRHTALAHHQCGVQRIGLGPQLSALFTCQHNLPP